MKKTVTVIVIALLVISVTAIAVASALNQFDPQSVAIVEADELNVTTTDRLEISKDFYVLKEHVDHLEANADTFKIFAIIADYSEGMGELTETSGPALTPSLIGTEEIDGAVYNVYRLSFGVIMPADYMTPITYRAFLSFRLNGKTYSVCSDYSVQNNVVIPYDEVYRLYCDRSSECTEEYPYPAGDGTYSKLQNIYTMTKILAAYTEIEIRDGKAVNVKENEYYKSAIRADYFDGVLTLAIPGSDIPEWMIHKLYVNGEERYFEIFEGRIRLVV